MGSPRIALTALLAVAGIVTALGTGEGGDGSGPDDAVTDIATTTPSAEYFQLAAADLNGDLRDDLAAISRTPRADGTSAMRLEVLLQRATAAGDADPVPPSDTDPVEAPTVRLDGTERFEHIAGPALDDVAGVLLVADLDGDASLDVAVTQPAVNDVAVFRQLDAAARTFAALARHTLGPGAGALAAGDVDLDGLADLLAATTDGVVARVQDTGAPGNFPMLRVIDDALDPATAPAPGLAALAFADLDGDDLADVVAVRADGTLRYPQNTGVPGTFAGPDALEFTAPPAAVALADLDGDGHADVLGTRRDAIAVLRGDPGAPGGFLEEVTFAISSGSDTRFLAVGDLDGDGDLDVVAGGDGDAESAAVHVFLQAAEDFELILDASYTVPGSGPMRGLALADVDADGRPDIVVSRTEIYAFPNTPAAPGGFAIPLQLTGSP